MSDWLCAEVMPNFEMPNLDCTSKEISIQSTIVPVRKSLVQWLTESRFGISKFGIPIEIRSDLKNKQSTERESHVCGDRLYH